MDGNGNGGGSGVPNLDRLFNYLGESLSNGWVYYVTAKHLRSAYESGRVTCARFFFMTTYNACLDRALQMVLEVVSGEDALLPGLLTIAERSPETFTQVDPETVRGRARFCHTTLAGLVGQIEQLRGVRGQLAMPTEEEIPDAALLETFNPFQLMGLQKAYRDALGMLNEFSGYYHTTPPSIQFVEETIQDDVEFIMSMLSGNCV
jgi:hypothetical protein